MSYFYAWIAGGAGLFLFLILSNTFTRGKFYQGWIYSDHTLEHHNDMLVALAFWPLGIILEIVCWFIFGIAELVHLLKGIK